MLCVFPTTLDSTRYLCRLTCRKQGMLGGRLDCLLPLPVVNERRQLLLTKNQSFITTAADRKVAVPSWVLDGGQLWQSRSMFHSTCWKIIFFSFSSFSYFERKLYEVKVEVWKINYFKYDVPSCLCYYVRELYACWLVPRLTTLNSAQEEWRAWVWD